MPIELIDKIKPKNNGSFALIDAEDIEVSGGTRLTEKLEQLDKLNSIFDSTPDLSEYNTDYVFDFSDIQKLSVLVSNPASAFGSVIVSLEKEISEDVFTTINSISTVGGLVSFDISSYSLQEYQKYRFKAISPFNKETYSEEISVRIVQVKFNPTEYPSGLQIKDANDLLSLTFKFDPISINETLRENLENIKFNASIDGSIFSYNLEENDTEIIIPLEGIEDGSKNLDYYISYELKTGTSLKSKNFSTAIYVITHEKLYFKVTSPSNIYSSDYWNLIIYPEFDPVTYRDLQLEVTNEVRYINPQNNEEIIDSGKSYVNDLSTDSNLSTFKITIDPVRLTITQPDIEYQLFCKIVLSDKFSDKKFEYNFEIPLIYKDLQLTFYFDYEDYNPNSDSWNDKIHSDIKIALKNIQHIRKDDGLNFTENSYGYIDLNALNLRPNAENTYKGFTFETLIKSTFLGNLKAVNLNLSNMIEFNYDKVKASYQGSNVKNDVFDDQYHHVVIVADTDIRTEGNNSTIAGLQTYNKEKSLRLYIDGILSAASPIISTTDSNDICNFLFINKSSELDTSKNNTSIKYIKFYNTSLTSADVYKSYLDSLSQEYREIVETRNDVSNILQIWFVRDNTVISNDRFEGVTTFEELHKIENKEATDTSRGSKTSWVNCDIYYQLPGDPTFVCANDLTEDSYKARILLQGTSTLKYPVKNYRINTYTEIIGDDVNNKKNYQSKAIIPPGCDSSRNWVKDSQFTLKCDYMESSHRNNTPTAQLYENELLPKVIKAIHPEEEDISTYFSPSHKSGYRDAIDGYPCIVYYLDSPLVTNIDKEYIIKENSIFAGSYMFNIDKEGLQLGFNLQSSDGEPIEMVSYEGGTNTNIGAAAFKSLESYNNNSNDVIQDIDKYIEESIEARYASMGDDSSEYLNKFKELIDFLNSSDNPIINKNADSTKFKEAFKNKFSYEYCMAYYIQMMLFAQVDSAGKNAMFDYWKMPLGNDNFDERVYLRPYDMDTQVGLSNFGNDDISVGAIYNQTLAPDTALSTTRYFNITDEIIFEFDKNEQPICSYIRDLSENDFYKYKNGEDYILFYEYPVVGKYFSVETKFSDFPNTYFDISVTTLQDSILRMTLDIINPSVLSRLSWSTNDSLLWKTFGNVFNSEIANIYGKLRGADNTDAPYKLIDVDTIDNFIKDRSSNYFGEIIYNADAAKRYLSHSTFDYYKNIQGNRNVRYYKYLRDRIRFLDSYFNISNSSYEDFRNSNTNLVSNTSISQVMLYPKVYSPTYIRVSMDQATPSVIYVDSENNTGVVINTQSASNKNFSMSGLGNAYKIEKLKELSLSSLDIDSLENLINLDLSNCPRLNQGIVNIRNKPYLTALYLNNINNSSYSITLDDLPNLETFTCKSSTINKINLPNDIPKLAELDLSGTSVSNITIENNDKLILDSNLRIEKASIKSLVVNNCQAIGEDITFDGSDYSSLSNLQFHLNNTKKLTLKNLKDLNISISSEVENFELIINGVSFKKDLDLIDLSNIKNLKKLSMRDVFESPSYLKLPSSSIFKNLNLDNINFKTIYTNDENKEEGTYEFTGINFESSTNNPFKIMNCKNLTKIKNLNIGLKDQEAYYYQTFYANSNLKYFENSDLSGTASHFAYMFTNNAKLESLPDFTNLDLSGCIMCNYAFYANYKIDPQKALSLLSGMPACKSLTAYMTYCGRDLDKTFDFNLSSIPYLSDISSAESAFSYTRISSIESTANTIRITNGSAMFTNCKDLVSIPENFLDCFEFLSGAKLCRMFSECSKLNITKPLTSKKHTTITNITSCHEIFRNCTSLSEWEYVDLISYFSGVEDWTNAYYGCSKLKPALIDNMFNSSSIISLEGIFAKTDLSATSTFPKVFGSECTNLKYASGMFAFTKLGFNTSLLIPKDLFSNTLEIVALGVKKSHYSGLKENEHSLIPGIFSGNCQLRVDLIALLTNLTNLTNISGMFSNIDSSQFDKFALPSAEPFTINFDKKYLEDNYSLIIESNNLKVSNSIIDESYLFANNALNVPASFTVTNYISKDVQDIRGMFSNSGLSLTQSDFSLKEFESLKYCDNMFKNCSDLTFSSDIEQPLFNSAVISASGMFYNCKGFNALNAQTFIGATSLKDITSMFYGTGITALPNSKLKVTIHVDELSDDKYEYRHDDENADKIITVENLPGLFKDCVDIKSIKGLFAECKDLIGKIPYNLLLGAHTSSKFSQLEDVSSLFQGCQYLCGNSYGEDTDPTEQGNPLSDLIELDIMSDQTDNYIVTIPSTLIYNNFKSIDNFPWILNINTDNKFDMVLSLDFDSIDLNYIVPAAWFKQCENIKYADYLLSNIGQLNSEIIDIEKIKQTHLPNELFDPCCYNLLTLEYAFCNTLCLGESDINNFLNSCLYLKTIKGLFKYSYIDKITDFLSNPSYQMKNLTDASECLALYKLNTLISKSAAPEFTWNKQNYGKSFKMSSCYVKSQLDSDMYQSIGDNSDILVVGESATRHTSFPNLEITNSKTV